MLASRDGGLCEKPTEEQAALAQTLLWKKLQNAGEVKRHTAKMSYGAVL